MRSPKPLVVGLVGGVGSGKSAVAAALRELGARVIDADRIAHSVLHIPAVVRRVRRRFGAGAVRRGAVDRGFLARQAFSSQTALADLERIVHPFIRREIILRLSAYRLHGAKMLVIDAPLLLEVGLDRICDRLVYVHAPRGIRERRVRRTRGWIPAEIRRREGRQMPLARKRRRCDETIVNDEGLEKIRKQASGLWKRQFMDRGEAKARRKA